MDFKDLADYVPVMVALVGVANTVLAKCLKKGGESMEAKAPDEAQSDLDVISAQLEEVIALLKSAADDEKKRAEMEEYLERCRAEKEERQ